MAAVASLALGFATTTGLLLVPRKPYRAIGSMKAQVTVEEHHRDNLIITEHPVEQGAAISDHAFKRPAEISLTVAWSNSPGDSGLLGGLLNTLALFNTPRGPTQVQRIYDQLLQLQVSRVPFTVYTGKRTYPNMLMSSLTTKSDARTENALVVHISCKQVVIAQTQVVTVQTDQSAQSEPQNTAPPVNQGFKQVLSNANLNPATALADAAPSLGVSAVASAVVGLAPELPLSSVAGAVSAVFTDGAFSSLASVVQDIAPSVAIGDVLSSLGVGPAVEVALSPVAQTFQTSLAGTTYGMTARWCEEAACWTMDVADSLGSRLLSAVPLVTGTDLLGQFASVGIAGKLFAQTDHAFDAVPTYSNLGTNGRLYYTPPVGTL